MIIGQKTEYPHVAKYQWRRRKTIHKNYHNGAVTHEKRGEQVSPFPSKSAEIAANILLEVALQQTLERLAMPGLATATLMIQDEALSVKSTDENDGDDDGVDAASGAPEAPKPRKCYIFCPARDRDSLFAEVDRKTAAPLLPEFQDYVLDALISRKILRRMKVFALHEKLDAWVLELLPDDKNVVDVLEQGLKEGKIMIPGAAADKPDGFDGVTSVTSYLNTFGVDVAERIRNQFIPLFDPATEPLSEEILTINDYIQQQAGYSLYDAQLAVAETVKRQLDRRNAAFIVAECGTGKTKIGSTALGALHGLVAAQRRRGAPKTFNLVMCPSHVTRKWVREIGETLPGTYAMVVRNITEFDRLYAMYEAGDKSVFAVFSKERARDGYMRYPAVTLNRSGYFTCPDCGKPVLQERSDDGIQYLEYADQSFFQKEHRRNHVCRECGSALWAPVVPGRNIPWTKVTDFGWVYKEQAAQCLSKTKNNAVLHKLEQLCADPHGSFPVAGAVRRFPLSTYIKKKYRGRIDGFLCDELHEYNNKSGQGDAMAELFGVSKQFVGMTATLINGYSSGIFHLLYRVVPGLMKKDGKSLVDKLPGGFRALTLDVDYYIELAYNAIDTVFENTCEYYNEENGEGVYVFCDPVIDSFCQLCLQYEQRSHLTEEENPYRKEMEAVICSGFGLCGYNYYCDWRLSANDRGRRRLLFFYGEEFCGLDELPEGLIEIWDGFQRLNLELEKALSGLTKQSATEKEAA